MTEPDPLARFDLFADLEPGERTGLAARLQSRRVRRGETISRQGDASATLYLIERGWVKLVLLSADGKEFVLDVLGPGAWFGEMALLEQRPRSADAVAQEDGRLLLLARADFETALLRHPPMARAMLRVLSGRLRRDAQLLHEAVFLDLPARLSRALTQLAHTQQVGEPPDGARIRATQEELAGMLGVTRESVNKWLGYFERQGLLRRQRGGLTLLRPDLLPRP